MIEYKDYAKFENLSELSEAIEIGLDIEFILYGERYNIFFIKNFFYRSVYVGKSCKFVRFSKI